MRSVVWSTTLIAACAIAVAGCGGTQKEPPKKGAISGLVVGSDGAPIVSAELETVPPTGVVVSGADGAYSLEVPAATYTVKVTRAGFRAAEKTDVSVSAGGTVMVDFTLVSETTTGAISGVVRAAEGGGPIAGATVVTEPATSSVTSSADGSFTLAAVAPGTYALIANADGFLEARSEGVEVEAGATTQRELQLAALVSYQSTCEECHLNRENLLADLTLDPLPEAPPVESEGEG